jgi:hypothetical protein
MSDERESFAERVKGLLASAFFIAILAPLWWPHLVEPVLHGANRHHPSPVISTPPPTLTTTDTYCDLYAADDPSACLSGYGDEPDQTPPEDYP